MLTILFTDSDMSESLWGLLGLTEAVGLDHRESSGCKTCRPHNVCMRKACRCTWIAWTVLPQECSQTTASQSYEWYHIVTLVPNLIINKVDLLNLCLWFSGKQMWTMLSLFIAGCLQLDNASCWDRLAPDSSYRSYYIPSGLSWTTALSVSSTCPNQFNLPLLIIGLHTGTGVERLTRGLPTFPKVTRSFQWSKARLEEPSWAWVEQVCTMWYFVPSVLLHQVQVCTVWYFVPSVLLQQVQVCTVWYFVPSVLLQQVR